MSLLNTDFREILEGPNSFRNDSVLRCPFTDAQAEEGAVVGLTQGSTV